MTEIKDEGICRFCLRTFSGRSMGRHLVACKVRKQKDEQDAAKLKGTGQIYHIKIQSYKPYWLHIEMRATATLENLDHFLRDIWLECCYHLSEFRINDTSYLISDALDSWWDAGARSMDNQLRDVLSVKDKFEYQYDFGSTTYVEGQVYAAREGVLKDKIRILARNTPPALKCAKCGTDATIICVECYELFCGECLVGHEGGEEMALPVANSPRMGVCGYAGEHNFDDFDLA